uniref:FAD-binding PCMH-type domain-containing protein n=1 Tax=Streptomyces sp. NBC_01401 TaxID=2903854 RepID=A0AAU3GZ31_9ACTN
MTVPVRSPRFADAREAADLAAFLGRLLHYDRAAAVRLQAGGGALAVFGRPPSFEVLAIRTARLSGSHDFDVTVSAGELLESLDTDGTDGAAGVSALPEPVTGPPWAGMLPPRGGWQEHPGLPDPVDLRTQLADAVAEFRARDAALPEDRRTRAERDLIGRDIWSRTVGGTELPLRAVHAAQSLGFLRPAPDFPVALLTAGAWLRLRTPFGSIALRGTGGGGLGTLAVTVQTA